MIRKMISRQRRQRDLRATRTTLRMPASALTINLALDRKARLANHHRNSHNNNHNMNFKRKCP